MCHCGVLEKNVRFFVLYKEMNKQRILRDYFVPLFCVPKEGVPPRKGTPRFAVPPDGGTFLAKHCIAAAAKTCFAQTIPAFICSSALRSAALRWG